MSKNAGNPPLSPWSRWSTILIIALAGVLLGSGVTYVVLRSAAPLHPHVPATSNPDPTSHRPDPNLTAGQTPAQAARTLGNFYYDHRNWPQAIDHYQAAIRQGSDDADIRTDLGNAYRFAGRPDDALAQYQLAQKMSPAHEFSLFNQAGLFLEDFKQPARAVELWQEYLSRFPAGRNVDAARLLIARAQGGDAALAPAPAAVAQPAPPSSSAAEQLILKHIEAAKSPAGNP